MSISLSSLLQKAASLSLGFWEWWRGEMISCIPPAVRERFVRDGTFLRVRFGKSKVDITLIERGAKKATTRLPLAKARGGLERIRTSLGADRIIDHIEVVPDPSLLFEKRITLPKGSPVETRQALSLQLERHFPLPAAGVTFSFLSEAGTEPGKQNVRLLVIKRSEIEPIAELLATSGLTAKKIFLRFADGGKHADFPFSFPKPLKLGWSPKRLAKAPVALSLAVWVVVFLAYPGFLSVREAVLQHRIEEAEAKLSDDVERISRFEAKAKREAILAGMQGNPHLLSVLEDLSAILPDEAWVETFSYQGGTAILEGAHPNPALLVQILNTAPTFFSPQLVSVSDGSGEGEGSRFRISLDIQAGDNS